MGACASELEIDEGCIVAAAHQQQRKYEYTSGRDGDEPARRQQLVRQAMRRRPEQGQGGSDRQQPQVLGIGNGRRGRSTGTGHGRRRQPAVP